MNKKQEALLKQYANSKETSFRGDLLIITEVAQDALDHDGYEIGYLNDVVQYGCKSGSCSGLIYYVDTHAFYTLHADECDDILNEYESETGEAFKFEGGDVRNTLAWMGYEERARQLLDELEELK